MYKDAFAKLSSISKNFGEIAKNVNASSLNRKKHTENAIFAIDELGQTADFLLKEITVISNENILLRNRHNQVLGSFNTLLLNIKKQQQIIKSLKEIKGLSAVHFKAINHNNKTLTDTLKLGIQFLDEIIDTSNEIILMDNEIIHCKKNQLTSINKLKKSTQSILKDAQKAIDGSKTNFDRGKTLAKKLEKIQSLFEKKKSADIKAMIEESKKGWKLAIKVNNSSQTQFDFAEEVYLNTQRLNESSERIRDSVIEKHSLFTRNLDPLMQMAVLIAVDCFDYVTDSYEIAEELSQNTLNYVSQEYHLRSDLKILIDMAMEEIELTAKLNLDMTDSIDANSRLEGKAVQLTAKELKLNKTITEEVESMTEETRYPIEGSTKNIRNGMEVENTLKELLKKLK